MPEDRVSGMDASLRTRLSVFVSPNWVAVRELSLSSMRVRLGQSILEIRSHRDVMFIII
jgi:hypothetical protein